MLGYYLTILTSNVNSTSTAIDKVAESIDNVANTVTAGNVENVTKELPEFLKVLIQGAQNLAIQVVIALVLFFIGKKIISGIIKFMKNVFDKSKIDESVSKFLLSLIRAICYIILIMCILEPIGITATGLAALVGSAGLTIGLGLQGSLQNFAGGVLILLLKPFRIGDYIIVEGYEGTVETIDIFYTKLLTIDNRMVVLPNGTLSNTNITNVTNEEYRRLDLTVGISYSQNIGVVKDLLLKIAQSKELVLEDHEVVVYVDSFADSSVVIGIRVWCRTENYWILRWDMLETIKNEFDAHGISIPFNQLDVKITGSLKDSEEKK